MQELFKFIIGIVALMIGFPLGSFLAKQTKEELRKGQVWFKILIVVSLIGAILSLIFKDDALLFSFLFVVIVTNRCLKR